MLCGKDFVSVKMWIFIASGLGEVLIADAIGHPVQSPKGAS